MSEKDLAAGLCRMGFDWSILLLLLIWSSLLTGLPAAGVYTGFIIMFWGDDSTGEANICEITFLNDALAIFIKGSTLSESAQVNDYSLGAKEVIVDAILLIGLLIGTSFPLALFIGDDLCIMLAVVWRGIC